MATTLQFLQLDAVRREPFAVGMCLRELLLDFSVIVYLALLRVDEQNLSRLQTTLAHHIVRLEVHHTHFRSHDHHAALRNRVTAGAQTISVQHTTSKTSIAEEQGSRTIPRLHQDRVIFVERLQVFADRILVVETLRHQNCHRLWQGESAHDQELKHVVQTGRVTHALLHDRTDVLDVAQRLAAQHTLTRLHPASVTTNRVDFTIVCQETERLCQTPCREGVRREA